MYHTFTAEGFVESKIATMLNERGIPTDLGRPWTRGTVHQVLTSEKYVGNNIYNKVSFKLKKKRVVNPSEMWIRSDGVFQSIVQPELFSKARSIILERGRSMRMTNCWTIFATCWSNRAVFPAC